MATIVTIIAVIGCLILATRSSALRNLGTAGTFGLALIWLVIILGLVATIQFVGLRVGK